ncbi:MAG: class IV adenylate cyclase [Pirellulales bacterium]
MKIEVEQKFRVDNSSELRQLLSARGVTFADPVRQVDAYFNHPARDFAQTDEALRIRSIGDVNLVTYKGPKLDRTVKTRRELEQPIAPGPAAVEKFAELLTALGFRPSAVVEKLRSAADFTFDGVEFELAWDEVAGIGTFLEIELVVEAEAMESAKARILALQQELGLRVIERRSYLEMVLEST